MITEKQNIPRIGGVPVCLTGPNAVLFELEGSLEHIGDHQTGVVVVLSLQGVVVEVNGRGKGVLTAPCLACFGFGLGGVGCVGGVIRREESRWGWKERGVGDD